MSAGIYSFKKAARDFKIKFAECWRDFLHVNFDSKEHVALVFGVDGSTAAKWWDGLHAPSGSAVAYAFRIMPQQATVHLAEAA